MTILTNVHQQFCDSLGACRVTMIADSFSGMNNRLLDELIREVGDNVDGQPGYWQFEFIGRQLVCITDEHFNRMRVMTPVANEESLSDATVRKILAANFDRALDAKYATSQDLLWAIFMHPLRELTPRQISDAFQQVQTLADNFGTSYSSCGLYFGGADTP